MITSPSDFIRALGGPKSVGLAIREKPGTVRMWGLRKCIPRRVWPDIIDAFPAVTLDDLKKVEPPRKAA